MPGPPLPGLLHATRSRSHSSRSLRYCNQMPPLAAGCPLRGSPCAAGRRRPGQHQCGAGDLCHQGGGRGGSQETLPLQRRPSDGQALDALRQARSSRRYRPRPALRPEHGQLQTGGTGESTSAGLRRHPRHGRSLDAVLAASRPTVHTPTLKLMPPIRPLSLVLILALLASSSSALACGGGGSGSYRKPARPGQHQHSAAAPSSQRESTAPQSAPR